MTSSPTAPLYRVVIPYDGEYERGGTKLSAAGHDEAQARANAVHGEHVYDDEPATLLARLLDRLDGPDRELLGRFLTALRNEVLETAKDVARETVYDHVRNLHD